MQHISEYNDFINESRSKYDGLASKLVSQNFKQWIKDWKAGKSESNFMTYVVERGLVFDLDSTIYFGKTQGFEVLDSTGADSRDEDDAGDDQDPYIIIDFAINPEWLPGEWQTVYMHLADVMRHEMEHLTQDGKAVGNYRMGKPDEDDSEMRGLIKMGFLPKHNYLMLPKEVDANLQGLRFEAKKRKEPMADAVNRYLDVQQEQGVIDNETRAEVLDLWRRRAKKIGGIPKF
jgi:hypothetical protein